MRAWVTALSVAEWPEYGPGHGLPDSNRGGAVKRFALLCALLSVALVAAGAAPAVAAMAARPRGPVAVTAAPRVPLGARSAGVVPGATAVTGTVVLRPRDEAALTRFIAAVTDPGSPFFHGYLPRGAFAARFGPARAAIDAVSSWLAAGGLRVTSVSTDGLLVGFAGSAGAAERAFGTGLRSYRLADGSAGQATVRAIRMPAAIARVVSGVVGLDSLVHAEPFGVGPARATANAHRAAATVAPFAHPPGSPRACPDATADAQGSGGLTDDDIAHAYGAFGLYQDGDLGAGQHIALFELDSFLPSDIRTFDSCYFGAAAAAKMADRLHVIPVDGGLPTGPGFGEALLDVEDVSAMAPGADIDVYEAPITTFGELSNYSAIVNDDRDQVVSVSYGLCEQAVQLAEPGLQQAENLLFQQAAAQGQSVFVAAGDEGSDACNLTGDPEPVPGQDPLSVADPASQPYVISVGGTTITDAATQPPAEQVWNDGADVGGGGGGISMSWAMPAWQRGSRVPGIVLPGSASYRQANAVEQQFGFRPGFCQAHLPGAAPATPCRTVPDVSADADPFTGAVTVYSSEFTSPATPDGWTTLGGTSSAAPIWAAMLAMINASAACEANRVTASGVGFAAPLLYAVASSPAAYEASFNDITAGDNDIYGLDDGQVFPAATGYDVASGLGSPQLTSRGGRAGLAFYLCSLGPLAARPAVTGLSPAVLPTSGGTVTITGTGFTPSSAAAVTRIQVGTWQVPPGSFTVRSNTLITAHFPAARDTLPPDSPRPLDGAGPADVVVSRSGGLSSAPGPASTLQYADEESGRSVPSVTGVSPYGGLESGPAAVTILGSGFAGTTNVTFGGVAAARFQVLSPFEIRATPAAYSRSTRCAPSLPGESPTTDICQAQVRVSNDAGTSAIAKILPPIAGAIPPPGPMGVFGPPPGCHCEVVAAPTEYDYTPAPDITSVSTTPSDPGSLASEQGGTLITVTGRGLDYLTIGWADFGNPALASSEDFAFTYQTGTQAQIIAPAEPLTTDPRSVPFSIRTLAGQSPGLDATYAGVPVVTSAVTTATGRDGGPDTGGTPIMISGRGFGQAVGPLVFADSVTPGNSTGTQYTYAVTSDTLIKTSTVQQNPALVDVEVCSVTSCSLNPPGDYFYLYPPGAPAVDSVRPASGPAAGGTKVTIGGQNLGCVTGVFFGTVPAEKFSNAKALLDCGSTTLVHATAPPGKAGSTVKVTVTTVESDFTGTGHSTSSARFGYTP